MKWDKTAIVLIGYQNDYFAVDGILRSVVEEAYRIHQYAFQSRFGFQRVLMKDANILEAKTALVETMILHFQFEIKQNQIDTASRILSELKELTDDIRLPELDEKLRKAEEQVQKASEVSTQIHYKLLEEMLKSQNSDKSKKNKEGRI
jgi:hypothetical protein